MAIAIRGSVTSATASTASSVTINYPSGHTTDDVLLLSVTHTYSGGPGITTPTGWTLLTSATKGFVLNKTFWRVDDGSLGSSLTVNVNLSGGTNAIMYAFSGASTTTPDAAQYSSGTATSATATFPTLGTWASNNGWDVTFGSFYMGGAGITAGDVSGYNSGPNITDAGVGWARTHSNDLSQTAVTTIGQLTSTWSASRDNVCSHVIILEPAAAAASGRNRGYIFG